MRALLALLIALPFFCGCVHTHLRHGARHAASIIPDMQQQQVLDNLARCCHNPDSLPYFAVAGGGSVQVTQDETGIARLTWNPYTLVSEALDLSARRGLVEQYSVAVTVDPDQLEGMRAAYQWVLGIQTPDNKKILDAYFDEDEFQYRLPDEPWFVCSSCEHPPKEACLVGRYCDKTVWVLPDGQDQLTRFTLAILDIATSLPPGPPITQQVKRRYDADKKLEYTETTREEVVEPGRSLDEGEIPEPVRGRRDFYTPERGIQYSPTLR